MAEIFWFSHVLVFTADITLAIVPSRNALPTLAVLLSTFLTRPNRIVFDFHFCLVNGKALIKSISTSRIAKLIFHK